MKLFAVESTAKSASVAICEDDFLCAQGYLNVGLTHSQTLMPLVAQMLSSSRLSARDITHFAVSKGPGSFTGLRIGIATIKGMAQALGTPCIPISTLEALAYNLRGQDGIACAVMDARCNQVYNAIFCVQGDKVTRLCEDRALSVPALAQELQTQYSAQKVVLVGDATALCKKDFFALSNVVCAPPHLQYGQASSVAFCALHHQEDKIDPACLTPSYLRLSQAQRLRQEKERKEKCK